jgi:PHD/YefM family antitoxin component YafN of YafNO toxin-antitoxin module
MLLMFKNSSQFIDPIQAAREFETLIERVMRNTDRVRIARDGERGCVLISEEELDSLEHAISVLSDAHDVRELARSLARVAHAAENTAGCIGA